MKNEEILANAPEHCFAVDYFIGSKEPVYICSNSNEFYAVHLGEKIGTAPNKYPFSVRFRSLSDIRRIVELEQKLEAAERERDELEIVSALSVHYMSENDYQRYKEAVGGDDIITSSRRYMEKFAIKQRIKGIYEATNYVADNNDISYLPNDFILELCEKYAEQLRQQLNGENQ